MKLIMKAGESSIYDANDKVMKLNYLPTDYKELHKGIINTAELYFLSILRHENIIRISQLSKNRKVDTFEDRIMYGFKKYDMSLDKLILLYDLDDVTKMSIAIRCLKALAYLHENNIIHGDVKPSNILINIKTDEVVLIDFGHAQFDEKPYRPVVGTESYQAPEMKSGNYDKMIDIYSMGITFHSMGIKDDELIFSMICENPRLRNTALECLKYLGVTYKPNIIKFDTTHSDPLKSKAYDTHLKTRIDYDKCLYFIKKALLTGQFNPPNQDFSDNLLDYEILIIERLNEDI